MAFGIYPIVSLSAARAKRDEAKSQLMDGHDPSSVRKLKAHANIEASLKTFERIARERHETFRPQWAIIHAADA